MTTNQDRAINYNKQLRKIRKKVARTVPKKLASPITLGASNIKTVRPIF